MKSKKLLSVLLCTALLTAAFSGCGQKSSNDSSSSDSSASTGSSDAASTTGEESSTDTGEPEPLTLPLSEDGAELEVYVMYGGTIMSDLNEIAGVQKAEEMTGVHINWIPVSLEEVNDKMGIMLSSGDYPDIIYPGVLYPGGVEAGIEEGVIYPDHDTLIRQYMPNYMAYLESNEEGRREATADSGKMIVVKCIVGKDFVAEAEGAYQGLGYRKDLLEGLGIDEPTTVDGWHDALVAAKESGIEHPFMLETSGGSPMSLAWGVVTGMPVENYVQMDGDTVVGSALQPGFAEYVDTMTQWYAEGLIDPNFTSFNYYVDTPGSVENNQHLLYSNILSAFTGNSYYAMRMCTNESEFIQPIVAPVVNEVYANDLEVMFLPGTVEYVKKKAAEASAPVYNYLFAKVFDYDGGRAAWHCSDIPYFFHNADLIPICQQVNGDMLNQVMSGAFVNFAKTGNPNTEGLPEWKPCQKDEYLTMVFGDHCTLKKDLQEELLPLLKQYKPPFHFHPDAAKDEDEEGGSAWVF